MGDDDKRQMYETAGRTETYQQLVDRLRGDLTALKCERESPIDAERRVLVDRWIELIELELKRLGEKTT